VVSLSPSGAPSLPADLPSGPRRPLTNRHRACCWACGAAVLPRPTLRKVVSGVRGRGGAHLRRAAAPLCAFLLAIAAASQRLSPRGKPDGARGAARGREDSHQTFLCFIISNRTSLRWQDEGRVPSPVPKVPNKKAEAAVAVARIARILDSNLHAGFGHILGVEIGQAAGYAVGGPRMVRSRGGS